MARKIVQILCHTLNNDETLNYHIYGNWSARTARKILTYTDRYACEVWYAVNNLPKSKTILKDRIVYRLYPSSTLSKMLESFYGVISSPELLAEVGKLDPENTIVLFQGERGSIMHEIIRKYPSMHYAIQYHGYGQPPWLAWVERLFITPIERKTFPFVSYFFVHIRGRIQHLTKDIHISKKKIGFQNVGVDFDNFKPRSKREARKKLGLDVNKFIMLYVGKLVTTKGAHKIVRAYKSLKKRYPQLFLVLIGASKSDPLYKQARRHADLLLETIQNEDLPLYYNAADVYCFLGDAKTTLYAGIGTAPTEALASNLNVISTNLIHLPTKVSKRSGYVPKNYTDFLDRLEFLIQNPKYSYKARRLVEPFTASSYMTKNLIRTFDKFFNR